MTKRYVAVLEGEAPATARPILATADPAIVAEIIRLIRQGLGETVLRGSRGSRPRAHEGRGTGTQALD
jgi:hypothetical protein